MNWVEYIAGIIAAAVLIPLIGYAGKALLGLRKTAVETITLRVPTARVPNRVRFGVLHVRDGTDQQDDKGSLLNKEHSFRHKTADIMQAQVRYERARGCQFKCFLDHDGIEFHEIKPLLEELGFMDVTRAASRPSRAYFLISGYRIVEASGDIRNNFAFPA